MCLSSSRQDDGILRQRSDRCTSRHMMDLFIDCARLLIFPTVMAFAASSDFFTMTISNRISLILVAGFAALAIGSGMPLGDMLQHAGAGGLVLAITFAFFLCGW